MRNMGGGIVMGSAVASSVSGKLLAMSFRKIERSDRVVPVVAMTDGRVLFGTPVRPDVLLAAYRIGFGDPQRKVERVSASGSTGAVLIPLLLRPQEPVELSEFLASHAISDLAIGRELIVVDGVDNLFSEQLDHRLGVRRQQRSAVFECERPERRTVATCGGVRQFGHWYRFAERPSSISAKGDVIEVWAHSGESRAVLFEFARPADPPGMSQGLPEGSNIISGARDTLPEFGTLNDFLQTADILRWGASAGAEWVNGGLKVNTFNDVRSVVFRDDTVTFDSRGAVEIELEQIGIRTAAAMASVPSDKLADAKRLNHAIASMRKLDLLQAEMKARGYSSEIAIQATRRAAKTDIAGNSCPVLSTMIDILKKDMPPADYQQLRLDMAKFKNNNGCSGSKILLGQFIKIEPWARGLFEAGMPG